MDRALIFSVAAASIAAAAIATPGCGDDDGNGSDDTDGSAGMLNDGGSDASPNGGSPKDGGTGEAPDAQMPDGGTDGGPAAESYTAGGAWKALEGYDDLNATGFALMVRTVGDGTQTSIQVSGLEPATSYPVHVHALPCDVEGPSGELAGPHYKIDPSVADTQETNELWVMLTTDADGSGVGVAEATHVARPDAMSVVIHDPATDPPARMLCADLVTTDPAEAVATGMLAPFAAAEVGDQSISGTAGLTRTATATTVSVDVEGLSATEAYSAHVHALPCDLEEADGHYKIDPSIDDAIEENELWPTIEEGMTAVTDTFTREGHRARPDAQSLVIHRQSGDVALKVACADLRRMDLLPFKTEGTITRFDDAPDHEQLAGSATMERTRDGDTIVTVLASGLTKDADYPVHVHDQACAAAKGGGHYKIDRFEPDTVEANEIWLGFTADASGMASATATARGHIARASAQSIVIHSPTDDTVRLGCVDLAP